MRRVDVPCDRMQLEVVDIPAHRRDLRHGDARSEEAMTMAGRIAIMNRGKFVQIGEPEEITSIRTTRYSAEFIGR